VDSGRSEVRSRDVISSRFEKALAVRVIVG
jgi:hypothetical protein